MPACVTAYRTAMCPGFVRKAMNGEVSLMKDDIKLALIVSRFTHEGFEIALSLPDITAYGDKDDIPYIPDSVVTLTNKRLEMLPDGTVVFCADDVKFNTDYLSRYAVIYDDAPEINKPLVAYIDFGAEYNTSGLHWSELGILQFKFV